MSSHLWTPPDRLARRLVSGTVDVVTGHAVVVDVALRSPGPLPLEWRWTWSGGGTSAQRGVGLGARHGYDQSIHVVDGDAIYTDEHGFAVSFPRPDHDGDRVARGGLLLERVARDRYRVVGVDRPVLDLRLGDETEPGWLAAASSARGWLRFVRQEWGRLERVVANDGRRLEIEWRGDLVAAVRLSGAAAAPDEEVRLTYDSRARLTSLSSAAGRRVALDYDGQDRLVRVARSPSGTVGFEWDERGHCTAVVGPDPAALSRDDGDPATVRVRRADGGVWTFTHDGRDVTSLASPSGATTRWTYDDAGDLAARVDPDGTTWAVERGWTGAVVRLRSAEGVVAAAEEPPAAEARTEVSRDFGDAVAPPPRLPDAFTAPANLPTGFLAAARLAARGEEERRGREEAVSPSCARGPAGDVTGAVDASGRRWAVRRDAAGRVASLEHADGLELSVGRDARGRVREVVTSDGRRVELDWDRDGRVAGLRRADAGVVESYEQRREDDGAATVVRDGGGAVVAELRWGRGGLLRSRRGGSGEEERYVWDTAARLARAESAAGTVDLGWDDRCGAPTRDLRDGLGVEHEAVGAAGRVTRVLGRFATRTERLDDHTTRTTDPTGRWFTVRDLGSGLVEIADAGGDREHRQYDTSGRLVLIATSRAAVPETARVLRQERVAPVAGRASPAHAAIERDSRGRVRLAHHDGGMRWFRYDAFDRLVEVRRSDGWTWTVRWDALDRPVETVRGDGVRRRYVWHGARLAAIHAGGDDGPLRVLVYADERATVPRLVVDYPSRWSTPESGRRMLVSIGAGGRVVDVRDESGADVGLGDPLLPPLRVDGLAAQPDEAAPVGLGLADSDAGVALAAGRAWDTMTGAWLQVCDAKLRADLAAGRRASPRRLLAPLRVLEPEAPPSLEPEEWPEIVAAERPGAFAEALAAAANAVAALRATIARCGAAAERFEPDARRLEGLLGRVRRAAQRLRSEGAAIHEVDRLRGAADRLAARLAAAAEVEEEPPTLVATRPAWRVAGALAGPPRVASVVVDASRGACLGAAPAEGRTHVAAS